MHKILVVGGNGFIGSAVCKAALARGMQVTSISSSGKPYTSAKGHSPAWASKVDWQKGDALIPETYAHIMPTVGGVVHTLGTLLEDGQYKKALGEGSLGGLLGAFAGGFGGGGNPLERGEANKSGYEVINRDTALRVCETFLSSTPSPTLKALGPRPFVYISAEDVFRPVISSRYIESKREAEQRIEKMMLGQSGYRGVYIRPSLVYHAHQRPLTSPVAALLDFSASMHSKAPSNFPTPSSTLRTLGSAFTSRGTPSNSPLYSMANALSIPPIHVEHVAQAICIALDPSREDVRGVIGVNEMRELMGWSEGGIPSQPQHA